MVQQDPAAALALVSARPGGTSSPAATDETDPDLKRAKDLIELHTTVKMAHQDGTDKALNEAREAVQKVIASI